MECTCTLYSCLTNWFQNAVNGRSTVANEVGTMHASMCTDFCYELEYCTCTVHVLSTCNV